eukprot:1491887-Lingulodinium_polyedra.AAC.1
MIFWISSSLDALSKDIADVRPGLRHGRSTPYEPWSEPEPLQGGRCAWKGTPSNDRCAPVSTYCLSVKVCSVCLLVRCGWTGLALPGSTLKQKP